MTADQAVVVQPQLPPSVVSLVRQRQTAAAAVRAAERLPEGNGAAPRVLTPGGEADAFHGPARFRRFGALGSRAEAVPARAGDAQGVAGGWFPDARQGTADTGRGEPLVECRRSRRRPGGPAGPAGPATSTDAVPRAAAHVRVRGTARAAARVYGGRPGDGAEPGGRAPASGGSAFPQ
ncbi:hypothetical protein GCM10020295_23210 [Streptomyces cinereospinus]